MRETQDFERIVLALQKTYDQLPAKVAALAVKFSKERFKKQNWLDQSPQPWEPRKKTDPATTTKGERGLLRKSGRLFRSIQKVLANKNSVIIEAKGVPYASIHNQGGEVRKNVRIRKHNKRSRKGKTYTVRAHKRQMDFTMPKRQFMGSSAALNKRMERFIVAEFKKVIQGI